MAQGRYTTTGTANSAGVTPLEKGPAKAHSLKVRQVGGTPGIATWTVVLEGSLDGDGADFTTILTHHETDGDKQVMYSGSSYYACSYRRIQVVALSLGDATAIDVLSESHE